MKPWINKLKQHVTSWNKRLPKGLASYVYRFDTMDNVAAILNGGQLVSRAEAKRLGLAYLDCAAPSVIANTNAAHKDFVRLYFYPKTPTQYRNEGIRPASGIELDAHCPVPVFLMFDFVDLIGEDETHFSNGNMGTGSVVWGKTEAIFDAIPFDLVYHRGSTWNHPQASSITFHRHAEVLVPKLLSTSGVVRIACRSHPERRTLLQLLRQDIRNRLQNIIQVEASYFFQREWAFVEGVEPGTGSISFTFHPPKNHEELALDFKYFEDGVSPPNPWTWKEKRDLSKPLRLNLANAKPNGIASLWIEGHLAFQDRVVLSDEPF